MNNRTVNFLESALIGLFLIISVAVTLALFSAVTPHGHVTVSELVASQSGTPIVWTGSANARV
jgi:hypothetical protein